MQVVACTHVPAQHEQTLNPRASPPCSLTTQYAEDAMVMREEESEEVDDSSSSGSSEEEGQEGEADIGATSSEEGAGCVASLAKQQPWPFFLIELATTLAP